MHIISVKSRRHAVLVAAALTALSMPALAQDTIRIGSLNDQTGPFADTSGPGWVDSAKMAIEDFGGTNTENLLE